MRELAALKADYEGQKEQLDRGNSIRAVLETEKTTLEAEKFGLLVFKSDLEARLSRVQRDHESSLAQVTQEANVLRSEVHSLTQQLDILTAQLFVKEQETAKLREMERKMALSFEKLQEEERALSARLKSEELRRKLLEEECEHLKSRLSEQTVDLKPWEGKVKELQCRLSDQVAAAQLAEQRLAAESRERVEAEDRSRALAAQLLATTQSKEELLSKAQEAVGQLEILKFEVNKQETESRNFQKLLAQVNEEKTSLISELVMRKQEISQLETEKLQHLKQIADLQKEAKTAKDSQTRDSGLKIKLKACEASLEEVQLKLHRERSEKRGLQEEVARLNALNTESEASILTGLHEYRAKVAFLEIELATAKQNVENAVSRIQQLQSQIERLLSENAGLQTAMTLANSDMAVIGPLKIQLQLQAQQMAGVREDLERGVGLLDTATESLEGNTTCYSCLELLKEAVMCLPCGHVYCQQCKEKTRGCTECGPVKVVSSVIRVGLIDTISGKVSYSRQVINSMRGTLARLQEVAS